MDSFLLAWHHRRSVQHNDVTRVHYLLGKAKWLCVFQSHARECDALGDPLRGWRL